MITPTLHDAIVELRMLMAMLAKVSRQALEQRLQALSLDISSLQYSILRVLEFEGQHTLSELSRKFVLDPSTLVPAVDALERKGYISRQRDPNDRRRMPISLTEAGQDLVREINIVHEDDPLVSSLQQMGDDSTQQLLTLIRDMVRHLPEGDSILEVVKSRVYSHESETHNPTQSQSERESNASNR